MPGSFARPGASFPPKEGIFIMTRTDSDAAGRAVLIPDLAELADRIDVVLAHPWIDRGAFVRDALHGLRLAVDVLPAGPGRDGLAALVARLGRVVADPQADREACLWETRKAFGPLAELTAADLRAAADRAAWVTGLRDLAEFLAAHPDVPVPPAYHTHTLNVFPEGDSDDDRRAETDRAAGVLGTAAAETGGGHYRATRSFGPVEFALVVIPRKTPADAGTDMAEAA
jgi:hypothetical protein